MSSSPRRRARELALQGLYERQLAGSAAPQVFADLAASGGYKHADQPYFAELWEGAAGGYDALLARVTPFLDRSPASLSPIERAVMVIGAWELLHRQEIDRLFGLVAVKGRTLVALRLYWKGCRVKVELGVGTGKEAGDKRADLKKRETQRETEREVARFNRRHR